MSSGEVKKVSCQDIQLVQNLIERCLQLYMSQKEVVDTLLHQAKIEPGFTELVWQKLEEENQEFFRAYHLRLIVKDQISRYNELLERQVEVMHQICPTGIASIPMSNGSQIPSMHQSTVCHAPEHTVAPLKSETMYPDVHSNLHNTYNNGANLHNTYNNGTNFHNTYNKGTNLHNAYNNGTNLHNTYNNGVSPLPPNIPAVVDLSTHARRIDASSNMILAQNSNVGTIQGMNCGMTKPEAGYAGNTPYMFGADGNVLDARYPIAQPNSQPLSEAVLDPENSSIGFLGQIPRNFSLSDLTADFANSSDILESYSRSPFLAADSGKFLDPLVKGANQGPIAP